MRVRWWRILGALLLAAGAIVAVALARRPGARVSVPNAPSGRQELDATLDWSSQRWDADRSLVSALANDERPGHLVRESAWYAVGLLESGRPSDIERAQRILATVVGLQIHEPGRPDDGTFRRTAEDVLSPAPVAGTDFDPNWRQFVGTTLVVGALRNHDSLPPTLRESMWAAARLAARSERRPGDQLAFNVALMHAFLLTSVAAKSDADRDLDRPGEDILERALAELRRYGTPPEHNSPTYYGVDLYAATLLARHGASERLRAEGRELLDLLWEDIARRYNASLREMCGPYERAYGIDMESYLALVGLWIWAETDRAHAPIPATPAPEHGHDMFQGSIIGALAVDVGAEVREKLLAVQSPHLVEQRLPDGRGTSRCWMEHDLMIGGLERAEGAPASRQAYPLTLHWKLPSGAVGWMCARGADVRARVASRTVDVDFGTNASFDVGSSEVAIDGDRLRLPGLSLRMRGGCSFHSETDGSGTRVVAPACRAVTFEVIDGPSP